MGQSIKNNFLLNLSTTITGLLFPLITFPYASRILMADGIGQVQFFQSIIDYVSLCTALGIPLYAVREIARIRDNKELRSRTTIEILLLHAILTLVGYIVVFILAKTVAKIEIDASLFFLLSTTLFFNTIGVAWFYQAIEDFKYITLRSLFVRILSLVALFIFVKTKQDLFYYAGILVIGTVGNNIFNFFRLRKYIKLSKGEFKRLNLLRHLIPALKIFILNLVISIYVNLDSVMLGFLKNEESVGYYAAATRLTKAILGIVSSLGAVLLPRFSNMITNGQKEEFQLLENKAASFTIALSLPMSVGLIFMAAPIIHIFCGNGFEPSILTLKLVAPIVLFIGLSGIIGMQILYPQGREKYVIISTMVGACINLLINYLLIPQYGQYGAALGTVIAEFMVTVIMILLGRKYLPINILSKQNLHYLIGSIVISILLAFLFVFPLHEVNYLLIGILLSVIVYYAYLLMIKDTLALQLKKLLLSIFKQ
ncbi:flippase [Bacteroides fragilis]|uniref:flippase n=1 Tax=Bacteroides fragilis TaxID=817 RepID=UPI00200F7382|nr:flippase [Bacteroides fragilis]MCL0353015.1 flippase [Bacteroides fragilis]MCL0357924.1 flippase [Bacteroides fragilis]MCL0381284.1 flippase [Bacteroides fragilis]MCL0395208.1 flippase [Bacteroides fragilis]MCL0399834.1 flippase [Bacteroides fragilis]